MIMKKLAFILIGLLVTISFGFSQNSKVVSAYNYHNNGKLDKAKENIDAATANGFIVSSQTADSLLLTIKQALKIYAQPNTWKQLQITAMNADYSWQNSASHYLELYEKAEADRDALVASSIT